MYKQHLLQNMEREIVLLKRLAPLIEEKDLDFRPAEKLRSTYELMQYVSTIGTTMMYWFTEGMTQEYRDKNNALKQSLTLANFSERLDEQWLNIQKYMEKISEEDLMKKTVELPTKEKMVLGAAIISAPIKWLAVYRMELFVYLKMCGKSELSTREAWIVAEAASAGNN